MINYNKVIDAIITNEVDKVVKATEYISPKLIVRAVHKGVKHFRKTDNMEIILTIGKPNYAEREFIKLCQKANEPFPIKKIQLKMFNPKKKNVLKKK